MIEKKKDNIVANWERVIPSFITKPTERSKTIPDFQKYLEKIKEI